MPPIAEKARATPSGADAGDYPTPPAPALLFDLMHRIFHSRDIRIGKSPDTAQELVVVSGLQLGLRVKVCNETLVIGRAPESCVRLADGRISRRHCRLLRRDGALWILDLGSTNRTYVNGRAVHLAEIIKGDHLTLGSTVLEAV